MKKLPPAFLFIVIILAYACNPGKMHKNVPACVTAEIKAHSSDSMYLSVDEYLFQDKYVYLFTPTAVMYDAPAILKDASCNIICHPGGMRPPNYPDCNGVPFLQNAKLVRNLYKRN